MEFTSQPLPHTPAGWMSVGNLANLAMFQTQQQSVDTKEGVERVMAGLFPQKAPYGPENYLKEVSHWFAFMPSMAAPSAVSSSFTLITAARLMTLSSDLYERAFGTLH